MKCLTGRGLIRDYGPPILSESPTKLATRYNGMYQWRCGGEASHCMYCMCTEMRSLG